MEWHQAIPKGEPLQEQVEERSVVFAGLPEGDKAVDLTLPDIRNGEYRIPLASRLATSVVSQSSSPVPAAMQWQNVLVPLVIKRFAATRAVLPLRHGCRLYLFRDGYLWRELESFRRRPGNHAFRDVNLAVQYGQDERYASTIPESHVLVPFRLEGHEPDYQIAFSELPWTWQQIEAMGGLAPDDPRNRQGDDKACEQASKLRARRCQMITFTEEQLRDKRTRLQRDGERAGHFTTEFNSNTGMDWLDNDLTVFIRDPLQDARALKKSHRTLQDVYAHCQESAAIGPLALADLLERLIAEDGTGKLEEGLDLGRPDKAMLSDWEEASQALPEQIAKVEAQLWQQIGSPTFLAQLADYTHSDELERRQLGVAHLITMIRECNHPGMLEWIRQCSSGEVVELELLNGEDEEINQWFQESVTKTRWDEKHPLLNGLNTSDRLALLRAVPETLDQFLTSLVLAWTAKEKSNPAGALGKLEYFFQKIGNTNVAVVASTLGQWLPEQVVRGRGAYRFLPDGLTRTMHALKNTPVSALTLQGQKPEALAQTLRGSSAINVTTLAVLGPLLLANMLVSTAALRDKEKELSVEDRLNAGAAIAAFFAFMGDQMKIWSQRWESHPQHKGSIAKTAIMSPRGQRMIKILVTVMPPLAAILETTLGAWRLGHSLTASGNGIQAVGSLVGMAAGVMLLAGLIISSGPLLLLAVLASIAGGMIRMGGNRSPLELGIWHGWFGRRPYAVAELPFPRPGPEELANLSYLRDRDAHRRFMSWVRAGDYRRWPREVAQQQVSTDYQEQIQLEIQAILRQLFNFQTELKVYRLLTDSDGVPGSLAPSKAVIALNITLAYFVPLHSAIRGSLKLMATGKQHDLSQDMYIVEQRADQGQRLTGLRYFIEVDMSAVAAPMSEVFADLHLDIHGDGTLRAPEHGEQALWVHYTSAGMESMGRMGMPEWQRQKNLAIRMPDSSGRLPRQVLCDQGETCEHQPVTKASFIPLLPTA